MRRPARVAAALAVAALSLTGCKFQGAASVPLPGGASGPFEVKVEFKDVLDLVPQSAVKVNDVTVGSVKKIELVHDDKGFHALVTCKLKSSVELPANTNALLRQTSLLGEKFVSLDPPTSKSDWQGELKSGDTITIAGGAGRGSSGENADIEEVLGALSLVLNGGSLEQLQVVNSELNKALKGRETEVRDFLTQLTGFVKGLDTQKAQITDALDGLDRLTSRLAAQKQTLDVALRDLPQGAAVLADERAQLTKMLTGLNNLGTVAVRVIQNTQQNTVADLKALQPILTQLAVAGKDLPDSLELLTTYPFPRTIGPTTYHGKKIQGGIRGDYANLFISVDADIAGTIGNLTGINLPLPLPKSKTTANGKASAPTSTSPTTPTIPTGVKALTEKITNGTQSDLELLLFGGLS